ncbi:hypothetical protein NFI96_015811 [Prochilodus magdalenae]|nr:hypothetical protein NFI96_015811 [Prochilodus magdalenae]
MDLHFRWLVFLLVVVGSFAADFHTKHMNNFIKAVEIIEAENPGVEPLAVVKGLRKAFGTEASLVQYYLGSPSDGLVIKPQLSEFLSSVIKHQVTEQRVEKGVVLTDDGITVALAPLLLGLEAGLQSTSPNRVRGLYQVTVINNLVRSFVQHSLSDTPLQVGARGDWNKMKNPLVFTLYDEPSLATDSLINGGMDGAILGKYVANPSNRPLKLSDLLKQYYNHRLDARGLDAAPEMISQLRRNNFRKLVTLPLLKRLLPRGLATYQKLERFSKQQKVEMSNKLEGVVNKGLKKFYQEYAVCPGIITRSMWEAQPYRGTPTQLSWPLAYLFIHHTYEPSVPCMTFEQCAADMRAMQRYHQDTNGWADIGYNFVVGGDGKLYEGRGWTWQGAHTSGYNSVGYGVSYIGDFTSSIPSKAAMDLVRYDFARCCIDNGRLSASYTLRGHRNMDSTSCPGDAFYSQITTWEHF